MGSGGVAIAALPTVICLKVPFSDSLGEGGVALTFDFCPFIHCQTSDGKNHQQYRKFLEFP